MTKAWKTKKVSFVYLSPFWSNSSKDIQGLFRYYVDNFEDREAYWE